MAISPAERRNKILEDSKGDIELFRQRIDKMLSSELKSEYWFNVRGMGSTVIDIITREYEAAGWIVSFQSDWRDGDALVFKERK